jgi:hypothetical protein
VPSARPVRAAWPWAGIAALSVFVIVCVAAFWVPCPITSARMNPNSRSCSPAIRVTSGRSSSRLTARQIAFVWNAPPETTGTSISAVPPAAVLVRFSRSRGR